MKKSLLFLAALAISASAFATNTPPPPKPKPDPKPKTVVVKSDSSANADAAAAAVSGSKAVSGSTSGATGGAATSGSTSGVGDINAGSSASGGGGGAVNDNSEFNSRAWSLVLPPPVFTPPMPRPEVPQGCPAPTETQDALQIAGPIFSSAKSLRDNSPCVAIRYSQILWDRCQYQKSDRILAMGMKKFAKEVGEDWDAQPDPNIPNYTLEECGILKRNMTPPPQQAVLLIPPGPVEQKPVEKKVVKKKVVAGAPCPSGQVLACKPVK